ncbi:sugar ABC transporter ATPase [Pseudomonas sp. 2FG]|uniref:sugar ABC transporter ATPase n=1 Tax=Pseudomonas sp. 2FG TaxID=2502191 RepID=UPI0010F51B3F|nr:sugar ABC transporter ATPase [Pseudomonas sp. 2FG]
MNQQQSIIVPQISTFPGHEAKARSILRWLVQRNIVAAQPSTCARGGNRMGYAIAEGARAVMNIPVGAELSDYLPFGQACNGLEIVTKRCIFTPYKGFLEEAGCPECRREIGEALFDSLEEWMPGHTDNFTCPECGHEDDLNGFMFLQPCAFSNLGFIFNNWVGSHFKASFLDEFAERLGRLVTLVQVRL